VPPAGKKSGDAASGSGPAKSDDDDTVTAASAGHLADPFFTAVRRYLLYFCCFISSKYCDTLLFC
jgi:hypothetical protein